MPAGDRTGPLGMGPMTGRGAGYCGGYGMPGWSNPMPGRGFGRGQMWGGAGSVRGGGRGRRNWYYATGVPGWARFGGTPAWGYGPDVPAQTPTAPAAEQEIEELRQQAEWLKGQLDAIARRMAELGGEG